MIEIGAVMYSDMKPTYVTCSTGDMQLVLSAWNCNITCINNAF